MLKERMSGAGEDVGDGAHTLPVGTGNAAAAFQVSHEVKSTDISLDGFTE